MRLTSSIFSCLHRSQSRSMTDDVEAAAKQGDKAYAEIGAEPIGRMAAQMFRGMVQEGMARPEALEALKAYLQALAFRPPEKEHD